jgi:hypothetical protein
MEWEGVLLGRSHSPNFLFIVRLKILHVSRGGIWNDEGIAIQIHFYFAENLAWFSGSDVNAVIEFEFLSAVGRDG